VPSVVDPWPTSKSPRRINRQGDRWPTKAITATLYKLVFTESTLASANTSSVSTYLSLEAINRDGGDIAMRWGKSSKASAFENEVLPKLEKLKVTHKACFQSNSGRYAYYKYLRAIYSLEEKYHKKPTSLRSLLEENVPISARKNSTITNLLISATSDKPVRMNSKWGISLRNARTAGAEISDLEPFIRAQGGPMKFGTILETKELKRRYATFTKKSKTD
jgi:ACT domain-containing protein